MALVALGVLTLGDVRLDLPDTAALRGTAGSGRILGSDRGLLRSRSFCGYIFRGAFTSTRFYAYLTASPFIFTEMLIEHTAAASFAGPASNRACVDVRNWIATSLAEEASNTIHRRRPLPSWLGPAFYRKAVDKTPKVGVNFLDNAEHAQAEHQVQLGSGGRAVSYWRQTPSRRPWSSETAHT
jgi:hypothetical protein